jgi:hypothetical protein
LDTVLNYLKSFDKLSDVKVTCGWFGHALCCSYYALKNFNSFEDAIRYVISLGGDTDTNACIAGALLGAFHGIKSMEKLDVFNDNLDIILNCDTSSGSYERPPEYYLPNLLALIDKLEKYFNKK